MAVNYASVRLRWNEAAATVRTPRDSTSRASRLLLPAHHQGRAVPTFVSPHLQRPLALGGANYFELQNGKIAHMRRTHDSVRSRRS